jgi:beta-mannosidase
VLNGAALRLHGVNWTSLDLLRGDPDEEKRCRGLLEAAVSAGVNAVRVWGGGGRERGFFYDLCDELGLLVWQELPIACVFLDHLPGDDAFLALARGEAQGIIRQLRHHPCLFLWCGGNEWGPGRHRLLAQALSEVAAVENPGRRWLPASPGPGDSHNWRVWHGKAPPQDYASDSAPLLSEFGLAAPPDVATLASILPVENLWPPGAAWERRQAQLDKLWHYAQGGDFGKDQRFATIEAFVQASQAAQARGLQSGIEAYRLRTDAAGAFIWQ